MSQILGLFYHLIALALVTKNVKAIKFEGVWDDLESKKVSTDSNSQNI